jgi:hypothetical protein
MTNFTRSKQMVSVIQMSNDQLNNRLTEISTELHRAFAYIKGGAGTMPTEMYTRHNSENTMFIRKLRKERARIETVLSERRLGIKHSKKSNRRVTDDITKA